MPDHGTLPHQRFEQPGSGRTRSAYEAGPPQAKPSHYASASRKAATRASELRATGSGSTRTGRPKAGATRTVCHVPPPLGSGNAMRAHHASAVP